MSEISVLSEYFLSKNPEIREFNFFFRPGILRDFLRLLKYLIGQSFKSRPSIVRIEFDSEIIIRAAWVMTSCENYGSTAAAWGILIECADQRRYGWSREEPTFSHNYFPHPIGC